MGRQPLAHTAVGVLRYTQIWFCVQIITQTNRIVFLIRSKGYLGFPYLEERCAQQALEGKTPIAMVLPDLELCFDKGSRKKLRQFLHGRRNGICTGP